MNDYKKLRQDSHENVMMMLGNDDDTQRSSSSDPDDEDMEEGWMVPPNNNHSECGGCISAECVTRWEKMSYFCHKRRSLLGGSLIAMGASLLLFSLDFLYGNWNVVEDSTDGGAVQSSYEPGNTVTFFVLILSIVLFHVSLSVVLVLFIYLYKRDIQQLEKEEEESLRKAAKDTLDSSEDEHDHAGHDDYGELRFSKPHVKVKIHVAVV